MNSTRFNIVLTLFCILFLSVALTARSQLVGDSSTPVMPFIQVTMSGEAHPGCYFLSNSYGGGPASPWILIIDNSGRVVAAKHIPGKATGFTVQKTGHLTYFDEKIRRYVVLDSNLNEIRQIYARNGYQTDNHELLMFENGHYMFLGLQENQVDMSRLVAGGDPFAMVVGALIQEYDENDNLVFEWLSYGKFNILDASGVDFTKSRIDYMHPNALDIDLDGNILLSSRSMDEITKINRATGEVMWHWGGKNNEFTFLGDTSKFYKQHCIRVLPNGNYLLFDNGNDRSPAYSRACE